jgi:hypothetical protein
LVRGFYSRSFAEHTAGVDLEQVVSGDFHFIDWIINAAIAKGDFVRQNLGRQGVPFSPNDLVGTGYPEKYPVGTRMWVSTKVLPLEMTGNRKTTAKGAGPFKIVSWEDSGMTAKLKEIANPKNFIERSIKFFYPVNVDEKDAVGHDYFMTNNTCKHCTTIPVHIWCCIAIFVLY